MNIDRTQAGADALTPDVSVVLPAFNPDPEQIREAVESVLSQQGVELELIVVDDGSAVPLAEHLAENPRLRLHRQENAGVAAARNAGLSLARGRYVAFLDHDDTWLPGSLARRLDVLAQYPRAAGVLSAPIGPTAGGGEGPWFAVRDLPVGHHRILSRPEYCDLQKAHGYFLLQGAVIRREIFEAVGGFDPSLFAGEDYDFFFRVLHESDLVFLQEACFRRMKGSMTSDPRNYQELVWSGYHMIRKQAPYVRSTWTGADARAFWSFHDMCIRSCLRLARTSELRVPAGLLRRQLSTLISLRNIRSWVESMMHQAIRRSPGANHVDSSA